MKENFRTIYLMVMVKKHWLMDVFMRVILNEGFIMVMVK